MGAEWWLVADTQRTTYYLGKGHGALHDLGRPLTPADLLPIEPRAATWILLAAGGRCRIVSDFAPPYTPPGHEPFTRCGRPLPGWKPYSEAAGWRCYAEHRVWEVDPAPWMDLG